MCHISSDVVTTVFNLGISPLIHHFLHPWQVCRPLINGQPGGRSGDSQARWGGRSAVKLGDPLTAPALLHSSHSIVTTMSIPSSSPERELSCGSVPQLECPSSPSGMDPDPSSTGSPVLSPDSSSHDAALSAPAVSPADSENLSPDELELLAKLEEQNRWDQSPTVFDCWNVKQNAYCSSTIGWMNSYCQRTFLVL